MGLALLAVGVLAVVLCLAAAANGYEGWAISMGLVAVLGFSAGMVWLLVEGRRVRRVEAKRLSAQHDGRSDDPESGPATVRDPTRS